MTTGSAPPSLSAASSPPSAPASWSTRRALLDGGAAAGSYAARCALPVEGLHAFTTPSCIAVLNSSLAVSDNASLWPLPGDGLDDSLAHPPRGANATDLYIGSRYQLLRAPYAPGGSAPHFPGAAAHAAVAETVPLGYDVEALAVRGDRPNDPTLWVGVERSAASGAKVGGILMDNALVVRRAELTFE